MERDLEIKNLLEQGKTIKYISEFLGVNHKVVEKVKKQGRYYTNMNTGEIIFTSKKISYEEQLFNYLCFMEKITEGNFFNQQKNKIIQGRALNPRLSVYLEVQPSQIYRWAKKELRLFGCNENGKADDQLSTDGLLFLVNEGLKFSKNSYKIDENGLLRGYKLWYVEVSPQWLFYLKTYIYTYLSWKKTNKNVNDREFYAYIRSDSKFEWNEYTYINTRVAIQYGKWFFRQFKKHKENVIKDALNKAINSDEWSNSEIDVPMYIYLEKDAYYNNLLTSEQKERVKPYIF